MCALDEPKTWNDLKILMRKTFSQHHLEEHISLVSSSVPNILKENVQHKKEDMKDEELATTKDVLEVPTDLVTIISENESKGNDICAMVSQDEHNFDVQDLSTVHAFVEQSLVKHFSILPFSQDDCLAVYM